MEQMAKNLLIIHDSSSNESICFIAYQKAHLLINTELVNHARVLKAVLILLGRLFLSIIESQDSTKVIAPTVSNYYLFKIADYVLRLCKAENNGI